MSQLRPRPERSRFKDAQDPPHPQHSGATMRFVLVWRHPGEKKEVEESYDRITSDPVLWCREIIEFFNSSLRPGETPREYVRCEVIGEVPPADHKWAKVTAMTQSNQYGSPFDKMQCERCGVTGKRFGLREHVTIDSKFRLKRFKRCDTTLAAQGKATV